MAHWIGFVVVLRDRRQGGAPWSLSAARGAALDRLVPDPRRAPIPSRPVSSRTSALGRDPRLWPRAAAQPRRRRIV